MNINISPSNLLGWAGVIGLAATAVIFLLYQIRRNDLKLLRESISDLTKRVEYLEKENDRLNEDLTKKSVDYDNLKFKKNYLKQIILESLNMKKELSQTLVEEIVDGKVNK